MARDASRYLGGMSGKAAGALSGRAKQLADLEAAALGSGKSGGKAKKITIKEGRSGKKKYK